MEQGNIPLPEGDSGTLFPETNSFASSHEITDFMGGDLDGWACPSVNE